MKKNQMTKTNKFCLILFIMVLASCHTHHPIAIVEKQTFKNLYNQVRSHLGEKCVWNIDSAKYIYDTFEISCVRQYKNGYYYIGAIKHDDIYPILTFDNIINADTTIKPKEIKVGDTCVLKIMPLFNVDRLPGGMEYIIYVNNVQVLVSLTLMYSFNVYMSPNVIGKYYYE